MKVLRLLQSVKTQLASIFSLPRNPRKLDDARVQVAEMSVDLEPWLILVGARGNMALPIAGTAEAADNDARILRCNVLEAFESP